MFGLGMGEIILIAVVALLAVGPDKLPQAARSIGRGIRDIRRQTDQLTHAIEEDSQIGDAVRELRSAWYGTAQSIPKNRYELGKAIDQMTRDDAPAKPKQPAELANASTTSGGAGAGGDERAPETPDRDAAPADDDGMPRIAAPAGIVARDDTPAAAENQSPSPTADGGEADTAGPRDPAHG